MLYFKTNQQVETPLGLGVIQGQLLVIDGTTETLICKGIAVRLPINEITRPCLNQSNCLTSHAVESGIWVFPESELK